MTTQSSKPLSLVLGALAGLVLGHLVFSKGEGRRVLAPNPYAAPWRVRPVSRGVWYVYAGNDWIGSVVGEGGEYVGGRGPADPPCGPYSRLHEAASCVWHQAMERR